MMDAAGALGETIVFLDHFRSLPDPRQRGKVIYPLDEVLLLCLLAVLAGAESFVEIARFGTQKLALLRRFRAFADGTPAGGAKRCSAPSLPPWPNDQTATTPEPRKSLPSFLTPPFRQCRGPVPVRSLQPLGKPASPGRHLSTEPSGAPR